MTDATSQPVYRLAPRVTMINAVRRCLRKYFTFSGRAPRADFWKFTLAVLLTLLASIILTNWIYDPAHLVETGADGQLRRVGTVYSLGIFGSVLMLGSLPSFLTVGWRRLHDVGLSGWFMLAPFATLLLLVLGDILIAVGPRALWANLNQPGVEIAVDTRFGAVFLCVFLAMLAALIVTLTRPGQPGPNKFGPNPFEVTQ